MLFKLFILLPVHDDNDPDCAQRGDMKMPYLSRYKESIIHKRYPDRAIGCDTGPTPHTCFISSCPIMFSSRHQHTPFNTRAVFDPETQSALNIISRTGGWEPLMRQYTIKSAVNFPPKQILLKCTVNTMVGMWGKKPYHILLRL